MAKVIYNKIIPFKGFSAMAFVWWIFVRIGAKITTTYIRHECIHLRQQKEMLVIFFFLWYGIEWLLRLIQYRNRMTAYKNISFEREAYDNMSNIGYLNTRKAYSFIKYIKQ
jgi:hypothetical protein